MIHAENPSARRLPRRLRQGSKIGVLSPSASVPSFFPERLARGEAELRRLGFEVSRGEHATARTGYTAGTPHERVAELHRFFADPDIDAVHLTIGGNNSNQMLDLIDYDLLRTNPKILVGYSDSTALINAVAHMTGSVTFHGPAVLPEFGEYPSLHPYTERAFLNVTCHAVPSLAFEPPEFWTQEFAEWGEPENWERSRDLSDPASWCSLAEGSVEGRLVGGNLETLLKLAGTPYWPDLEGAIFFWEEGRQSVALVDSHLSQLKQMGVFDRIAGMVVGRPYHCDDSTGVSFDQLISRELSGVPFPVLADVDLGHTDPMVTLPIGIRARLEVSAQGFSFSLLEPAVR